MADGVLSLKGILVGARGSGSGGHVIKDNGTAVTQRPTMNMTDFDIADDNTNEETDIKPHRITSAEMSEICSPLPDAPTLVGNVRMSLLWENPSPTSDFAGQTVLIDNVGNYDLFVVVPYSNTGSSCVVAQNGYSQMIYLSGTSTAPQYGVIGEYRSVRASVSNGGLVIGNNNQSYTGSGNTIANSFNIPYKIYGIKLI